MLGVEQVSNVRSRNVSAAGMAGTLGRRGGDCLGFWVCGTQEGRVPSSLLGGRQGGLSLRQKYFCAVACPTTDVRCQRRGRLKRKIFCVAHSFEILGVGSSD